MSENNKLDKLSIAGSLITLGIVYGDIGTSTLYTLKAIMGMSIEGNHAVTEELILGGVSCIFWTLTIITSFKYIYLALNADNKGEGGIFALYALVRRYKAKWTIVPALIGCAALMADGFVTPPISISSAVEGLTILYPELHTVPIVLVIIAFMFMIQRSGTDTVGKLFGPIMFIWFVMIGVFGFINVIKMPFVLNAINPIYAFNLIFNYDGGFWFLGAVLLCTTGAEALYSDLGHCGKSNIRASWTFVKICLVLNYFGQASFILSHNNGEFNWLETAPFYALMPREFLPYGIAIATAAAIIASQALISGAFTLVNEAMKLRLWPNMIVNYPTEEQGQIYIPSINWLLFFGCTAVVLVFRESSKMEAAYGLAITINMLMTTALLAYYLLIKRKSKWMVYGILILFISIEGSFFLSSILKFAHGGWFTVVIAIVIFGSMYLFNEGRKIRNRHLEFVEMDDLLPQLIDLQNDITIPREATNLVYLVNSNDKRKIDSNIIYSLFRKKPKRADAYWFVHVDITNEPYGAVYSVDTIIPEKCFFVKLQFGFKVEHKVHAMFMKIVEEMGKNGEIDTLSHYPSLRKHNYPADFKFVLITSSVSADNELNAFNKLAMDAYAMIKSLSVPVEVDFGLERTNVRIEKVPINIAKKSKIQLERL